VRVQLARTRLYLLDEALPQVLEQAPTPTLDLVPQHAPPQLRQKR
jgi:hypothetical protein